MIAFFFSVKVLNYSSSHHLMILNLMPIPALNNILITSGKGDNEILYYLYKLSSLSETTYKIHTMNPQIP
jgi:hypothetical protein